MKPSKKERDKMARTMRKAGLLTGKLADLTNNAIDREHTRQLLTPKQLATLANVHIGNKLLKPDAGFYKPDGKTRTYASVKSGKAVINPYHVSAPKKQKGAGIYKRNPLA